MEGKKRNKVHATAGKLPMLCVVEFLHVFCLFVLLPPDFLPCGARYLTTTITKTVDKLNLKLGNVARVEVEQIDLGASPLQILGVKVRRGFKKRFPKFSEAASFCCRFAWTEKQNTPMCIGTCSPRRSHISTVGTASLLRKIGNSPKKPSG